MERRLALVLATRLGGFSLFWVIDFKVVPIDHASMRAQMAERVADLVGVARRRPGEASLRKTRR